MSWADKIRKLKSGKTELKPENKKSRVNLLEELGPLEDGETYYFDEETEKFSIKKIGKTKNKSKPDLTKRAKGGMINKYAKGGEVKGYMDGGEVEVAMDDSPSSGMITQRGWGASRKT